MTYRVAVYLAHKAAPVIEGVFFTESEAFNYRADAHDLVQRQVKADELKGLDVSNSLIVLSQRNTIVYGSLQAICVEEVPV